jgi:hypothetical protein
MALSWPAKDPEDRLDYSFDWRPLIGEDVIDTHDAVVVSGTVDITDTSLDLTKRNQTVWLMGGVDGETSTVHLTITTEGQRTLSQLVLIKVVTRR